ncbi:MAG: TetR/AcrR family transcriptional regulator [Segniliparus sp.]|uniref:TetR/AcrR family transcriptional regulator n=1 Tax=Segniliparus sp. TaxID=2804064 RepID=UPI003F3AE31D
MASSRSGSKGVPRAEREVLILDAAALEFSQRGYAGTTLAQVAERADISKPLIHAYFDSKEGLYCACVRRAGEEVTSRIAEVLAKPPASVIDKAVDVLHSMYVALEPRPYDWKVLLDTTLPAGSAAEEASLHYRKLLIRQGAAALSGRYSDELDDPKDLSALVYVWTNVVTAMVNWWLRNPDQSAQQMTERSGRIFALLTS